MGYVKLDCAVDAVELNHPEIPVGANPLKARQFWLDQPKGQFDCVVSNFQNRSLYRIKCAGGAQKKAIKVGCKMERLSETFAPLSECGLEKMAVKSSLSMFGLRPMRIRLATVLLICANLIFAERGAASSKYYWDVVPDFNNEIIMELVPKRS